MPNLDGGHYFLTALIPVKTGLLDDVERNYTSHTHALRSYLSRLPTALQSRANEKRGVNSPFARGRRTHFARLVVVDDVAFNGRVGSDSLLVALSPYLAKLPGLGRLAALNPLVAQPADRLPSPYLIFVADFDAQDVKSPSDGGAALDIYLQGLWAEMGVEWEAILRHCHGFHLVRDGQSFAAAIRQCQVETTMPFNDYWQSAPDMAKLALPLAGLLAPAAIGLIVLLIGIRAWVLAAPDSPWQWAGLAGAVLLLAGLVYAYRKVLSHGLVPFPAAPDSDLPSVLKSLYIQQNFVRFAIDHQNADPPSLHRAFGAFLAEHRPVDLTGPSQPAGVVRSPIAAG